MADLEEPILPTAAANAGHTFMNAFYAAAQIAGKRRQLEEQITKMDMQMGLAEQKHQLDEQKMENDYMYKNANLQRGYDMMAQRSYLQEKGFEHQDELSQIKTARKDAVYDNASQLGDELAAASQKYPVGSQSAENEFNYIATKHAGTLSTPEGQRVWKTFAAEHTAAANEGHKYASELRQNFDSTLGMVGGSINRQDFLQPESSWQTDRKSGNRFLARVSEPVPGNPNLNRLRTLSSKEVKDMSAKGQGASIRYDSLPSKTYDQLRKMHNRMLEIGGNDPSDKPAAGPPTRADRARQALNDPDATEQEKAAATKILAAQQ